MAIKNHTLKHLRNYPIFPEPIIYIYIIIFFPGCPGACQGSNVVVTTLSYMDQSCDLLSLNDNCGMTPPVKKIVKGM